MATGDSIYVDPGGVQTVTVQMKMAADEIERLQHQIAPQVQNVLDMGQSRVSANLEVQSRLWLVQEQLGRFNYLAGAVVNEVRSAAASLTQIALLAEASAATLASLKPTVPAEISTTTEQSSLGVDWSTASNIVQSILQSDQFKQGADIAGSFVGLFGPAGLLGAGLGAGFDIASNGDWNPRNASGDIIGASIGVGVSAIPVVGEIVDGLIVISTADHLEATALSWGQGLLAQEFSGTIKNQLMDSSYNWDLAAKNSSISPVYDSLGLAVTDIGIGIVTGNFSNVPGDFGNAGLNAGRFALSFGQMDVNIGATILDDQLALGDRSVQVLPVPQSVKNVTNADIGSVMQSVNGVANFVTQPNDMQQAWNWAKGLI